MIYIPGNCPSSKNSKQWTGKMLISSKTTRAYVKEVEKYFIANKSVFLSMVKDYPVEIHFYFIRDSKRRFDYINVVQIVLDLMQKYEWIPDDSAYYVTPVFDGFTVDKQKAGVYISLTKIT